MALAPILAGLQIGGGLISGYGNMKANERNKDTKARLGYQISDIRGMADPVGRSLVTGLQPGGFLRGARVGAGMAPVASGLTKATQGLRSQAYRFGGSSGGLAAALALEASQGADLGFSEAGMDAEVGADDLTSRMNALLTGYSDAFNPTTVAVNPYQWAGNAITSFAGGFGRGWGGEY